MDRCTRCSRVSSRGYDRDKKSEEQFAAVEVGGLTPLDYLLSVMRDEARTVAERTDAAKAAAPYVHPKLFHVDAKLDIMVSGYKDSIRMLAEQDD